MLHILQVDNTGRDYAAWPGCSIKGCGRKADFEYFYCHSLTCHEIHWRCMGHAEREPAYRLWCDSYATRSADYLAGKAVSRGQLQSRGWRSMLKSSDFFHLGYSISHWINPSVPGVEILEYNPCIGGRSTRASRRYTACCFEQQEQVHKLLGVGVSGRGEVSPTACPMPLFDKLGFETNRATKGADNG